MISIATPTPNQQFPPGAVPASGSGGPVMSWKLFKNGGNVPFRQSPAPPPPVDNNADWSFMLPPLGPGDYTLELTDQKGGTTSVDFKVVSSGQ